MLTVLDGNILGHRLIVVRNPTKTEVDAVNRTVTLMPQEPREQLAGLQQGGETMSTISSADTSILTVTVSERGERWRRALAMFSSDEEVPFVLHRTGKWQQNLGMLANDPIAREVFDAVLRSSDADDTP